MPTIDDLRDALVAREIHAGDPDIVRERLRTPRQRRNLVLPVIAAAAVAALAVTVAIVATRRNNTAGQPGAAPPLVRWHVVFAHVPGYDLARTDHRPQYEMGLIEPTKKNGIYGTFWRYRAGEYRPETSGERVTIHDKTGYYSTVDGSQVRWQYAPRAWAVVAGTLADDIGTLESAAETRAAVLSIARAMRFGRSDPVTLPFALHNLPPSLTYQAAYPHGAINCVGYGAGDPLPAPKASDEPDDYGTVLSVCRVRAGETTWLSGDRWAVRRLPDGTELTVVVNHRHLDQVSAAQVRRVAAQADVSPKFHNQKTWLPIRL